MAAVLGPAGARAGEGTAGSPPEAWLSAVQQRIAEEEYQVTWQERTGLAEVDAAWQAPNRAHGFRTYFAEEGIRVVPRTGDEPSWEGDTCDTILVVHGEDMPSEDVLGLHWL